MVAIIKPTAATNAKEIDCLVSRAEKLEKTVYGNGDPGMDEQIRYIVRWIDERKKREDFIYYTTVGAALSALVVSIINIVLLRGG